jgi:hypothetical protein
MDAAIAYKLFGSDHEDEEQFGESTDGSKGNWMWNIIGLVISVAAAYLSWQCNAGRETLRKVIRAIISFIFATFYLIWYAISGCKR